MLDPSSFLEAAKNTAVIDVRSPKEFAHAHIPKAINIPLFDDEERAKVGTLYKQQGKDAAVLLGLEMVGPKLANFVKKSQEIAPSKEVLVHCWRGGMRSGSFAWLLKTAGFKTDILKGGYKAYRNHVLDTFKKPYQLIVLGGKTGSGKTEILKELKNIGEQVIDLEGLANHKGSSFGMLGQAPQPSSEMFENLLAQELAQLDNTRPIWIEDESQGIGHCFISLAFWQQMRVAKTVVLDVSQEIRVKRLVQEYASFDTELLENAINRIQKRLGGLQHKKALEALTQKNFEEVARMTLHYYDKSYQEGVNRRDKANIKIVEIAKDNCAESAILLKNLKLNF